MEFNGYDQYQIRMDGSGRVNLRNRQFLKKIVSVGSMVNKVTMEDGTEIQMVPIVLTVSRSRGLQWFQLSVVLSRISKVMLRGKAVKLFPVVQVVSLIFNIVVFNINYTLIVF